MKPPNPKHILWAIILIVHCLVIAACWMLHSEKPEERVTEKPHPGLVLGFPTPQTKLDEADNPKVFMPTASGKVVSAAYGSTRTRDGKPAFHEGVDIAPMERDSKKRSLDPVFAVADGRVGYISRRAGNSSYGIYVVLLHEDRLGEYHTLYAHLASVPEELKAGDDVARGMEIGRMGHTSTLGIPVQRSHVHFEFGTMLNSRFDEWLRSKKMTRTHGNHHGWNLAGLNPTELFPFMKSGEPFVFETCILNAPVAFRLLLKVDGKPDYYCRYPLLWVGEEPDGAIAMDVSGGGVPLRARAATPEETELFGKYNSRVLEAFPDVLGRNGKRFIVPKGERWITGKDADQWIDILLHR